MENTNSVWEVSTPSPGTSVLVVAEKIEVVEEYYYLGDSGGMIRQRPDLSPTEDMPILKPKPTPPPKASDFTKLEYASLMIAQGFAANANTADDITVIPKLSKSAVLFAKAVLEEAK